MQPARDVDHDAVLAGEAVEPGPRRVVREGLEPGLSRAALWVGRVEVGGANVLRAGTSASARFEGKECQEGGRRTHEVADDDDLAACADEPSYPPVDHLVEVELELEAVRVGLVRAVAASRWQGERDEREEEGERTASESDEQTHRLMRTNMPVSMTVVLPSESRSFIVL